MTRIILIATVFILVSGPVESLDAKGKYSIYGFKNCSKVLSAHANLKTTSDGWQGNHEVWELMGYVSGYATAINMRVKGKRDYFSGMENKDIANWIASWCRSNPGGTLDQAFEVFTNSRIK